MKVELLVLEFRGDPGVSPPVINVRLVDPRGELPSRWLGSVEARIADDDHFWDLITTAYRTIAAKLISDAFGPGAEWSEVVEDIC